MASIMPVCASANAAATGRRLTTWACGALSGLALSGVVLAEGIKVVDIQPQAADSRLVLDGSLDFTLSNKVEEALNNGIPLAFILQTRLQRRRALLWDETVGQWEFRREIRYHALSDQYLVATERDLPAQRQGFQSLMEALAQVATIDALSLPLTAPLAPEHDYRLELRVHLDVEALPPVLRPVAYTSRAWDLNSGWTTWNVQR